MKNAKGAFVGRLFSKDKTKNSNNNGRSDLTRLQVADLNDPDSSTSTGSPRAIFDNSNYDGGSPLNSPTTSPTQPYAPSSPFNKSPWSLHAPSLQLDETGLTGSGNVLIGSLLREQGHIYSLASSGDLLYTGSDSKNIRVWKNHQEFAGFKCHSGLVKAIVISGEKIFTGHQDGKIRVWRLSNKNGNVYRRVGTLPTMRDYIKSSLKPGNYVEVKRRKNAIWIKHIDTISCLGFSEDQKILYSSSWDKTFKVWRVSDFRCLESVIAHDDAVNAIVAGFDCLVLTGSADGTVKVWKREHNGRGTKHTILQTLLKQECAVTALAIDKEETVVYSGSSEGAINFWNRDKHLSHGGVLRAHKFGVLSLITAGRLILSGSADATICVWRREERDHLCLSVLRGHSGPVKCLAVEKEKDTGTATSPEETWWIVYSGSLDKSVKMWRVSEQSQPLSRLYEQQGGTNEVSEMPTSLPYAPSFSDFNPRAIPKTE
ncbi:hypothetical protein MLD38_009229 [Melastoma candidum]|uniref:Uncharacterized protein n=1 Tax=Melastoma candidum TaxID=119954 RepID=A0ACB9RY74_9MYRT|nr:hypothetical protein MLD38_009229 [Melastoma candidum]